MMLLLRDLLEMGIRVLNLGAHKWVLEREGSWFDVQVGGWRLVLPRGSPFWFWVMAVLWIVWEFGGRWYRAPDL